MACRILVYCRPHVTLITTWASILINVIAFICSLFLDSYDMVKKLRKMMRKMEKNPSAAVEADKASFPF